MIAPSTIAQTAHYTWLCTICLLPFAFRNTFLMFHLLNSKLVWSPGASADTGVLCFSLDAKVIRLRCFLHIKWSLVKELCCIYSLPGLFLAIWALLPSGAFDLQYVQEVPGGQHQPVPKHSWGKVKCPKSCPAQN